MALKYTPEQVPNKVLSRLLKRSLQIRNLPFNSGAEKIAVSEYGLGIPLTPVQRIILRLCSNRDNGPGDIIIPFRGELFEKLAGLLGLRNSPKRIWLPPDSEVSSNQDGLSVHLNSPITILLCVAGRRSGKTTLASILMSALARRVLYDPEFLDNVPLLDNSIVSLINVACDTHQGRILFKMLTRNLIELGILKDKSSPMERIQIGRLLIESLSSSSRSSRGRTACGICFDEFAHFQRTNGPLSDNAVWTALTPSLATFGDRGLAVVTTTPAGRSGIVWNLFEQRGQRPGMLTIQTPTWVMNPNIPREQLDDEYNRNETLARQEYGAEFLEPRGRFLDLEAIKNCVSEIIPAPSNDPTYHIHVDLGFKHDATAIALGYLENQPGDQWRVVIEHVDISQAEPGQPLSPVEIEKRILKLAEGKSISGITFDQHQSAYLIERLKSHGYNANEFPATSKTNQETYSFLRDLITSGRILLADNLRLIDELASLECTITSWGFKVQAAYGCHDDTADAVAVCAWFLGKNASQSSWTDIFSEIGKKDQ